MRNSLTILLIVAVGLMFGQAIHRLGGSSSDEARVVQWGPEVRWLTAEQSSYQAYFRHTLYVDSRAESAWLRLSSDNDYRLYVNGKLVSQNLNPTNPLHGLGTELRSRLNQRITDSRTYRGRREPLLSLWDSPDWQLCVYEDISKYIEPGRNVIALVVQNTKAAPRFAMEGEIQVTASRRIAFHSGEGEWKSSTQAENSREKLWFQPEFADQYWALAKKTSPVVQHTYSRISQASISLVPRGQWISGPQTQDGGDVFLVNQWDVPELGERAYVRVSANAFGSVMVNGQLIEDPDRIKTSSGRLNIYEVSRLLKPGENHLAVRLSGPLAQEQPGLEGSPVMFYADGWVEDENGNVYSRWETGEDSLAITAPTDGWYSGAGQSSPAQVLGKQQIERLVRTNRGDGADFYYIPTFLDLLWHLAVGQACAIMLLYLLKRYWVSPEFDKILRWRKACALALPATAAMAAAGLLAHRYREFDMALILTPSFTALLMIALFISVLYLTLLRNMLRGSRELTQGDWPVRLAILGGLAGSAVFLVSSSALLTLGTIALLAIGSIFVAVLVIGADNLLQKLQLGLQKRSVAIAAMLVIVLFGFLFRLQDLSLQDLWADENTSLDAIYGIMRTGEAPETTSGIWYTRSPAYHYSMAVWLQLLGDSPTMARLYSVVIGTALLAVMYFFTYQITQRTDLSLLVTLLMAVDRWAYALSRIIRFYVVVQLLTMLCFWLFYRGFVERRSESYRYWFFVVLTLAMLHQEMMIVLVPIFLLGFVMFYKPFSLRKDWPLFIGAGLSLAILFFDIYVFEAKCLTPSVALGRTTDSIVKPHLQHVTSFFSTFFTGSSGIHIIYSVFFFTGLLVTILRRDRQKLFLYLSVLVFIAEITVLLRQISLRYTSPFYPMFVMLAVLGAFDVVRLLAQRFGTNPLERRSLRTGLATILLVVFALGEEYPRLMTSSEQRIVRATTEVTRYIRKHSEDSDIVISPSAPPAAVELGGLDYYIPSEILFFDIPYRDGNVVRDRWGGGVLLSNPESFSRVFEDAERVWIYYDDLTEARLGPDMLYYLRTTGQPVMESYAAKLRMWQRDRDPIPLAPHQGRDLGAY